MSALNTQIGGTHYKNFEYQPADFLQDAGLGWCESNVIKYVARHRFKNGEQDLDKAIHYLQILHEKGWKRKKVKNIDLAFRFYSQFSGDEFNLILGICLKTSFLHLISIAEKLKNDVYRPF